MAGVMKLGYEDATAFIDEKNILHIQTRNGSDWLLASLEHELTEYLKLVDNLPNLGFDADKIIDIVKNSGQYEED